MESYRREGNQRRRDSHRRNSTRGGSLYGGESQWNGNGYAHAEADENNGLSPSHSPESPSRPRSGNIRNGLLYRSNIPTTPRGHEAGEYSHNYTVRPSHNSNSIPGRYAGEPYAMSSYEEEGHHHHASATGHLSSHQANDGFGYQSHSDDLANQFGRLGLNFPSHIHLDSGDNDHSNSQARGLRYQRNDHFEAPAFGGQELGSAPHHDRLSSVQSSRNTSTPITRRFQSNPGDNLIQRNSQPRGNHIQGNSQYDGESLDPRYQLQRRGFFKTGRVFSILWHETAGNQGTVISQAIFQGRFGEKIHSGIRRMVVVKELERWAWCMPITTYGGRGVAKTDAIPSNHAIVYMAGRPPTRIPDRVFMTKDSLEVDPATPDQKLDPMSRLNFGKVYTVEYNVKVLPVGMISQGSMDAFRGYARAEMALN